MEAHAQVNDRYLGEGQGHYGTIIVLAMDVKEGAKHGIEHRCKEEATSMPIVIKISFFFFNV